MKRRMVPAKGVAKSDNRAAAPAKPEMTKTKVMDPKEFSTRRHQPKKTEMDVMPPGKRPKGSKVYERTRDKRI